MHNTIRPLTIFPKSPPPQNETRPKCTLQNNHEYFSLCLASFPPLSPKIISITDFPPSRLSINVQASIGRRVLRVGEKKQGKKIHLSLFILPFLPLFISRKKNASKLREPKKKRKTKRSRLGALGDYADYTNYTDKITVLLFRILVEKAMLSELRVEALILFFFFFFGGGNS